MTVKILCVEYLSGDDIFFDAFRDVFTSELVKVRGGDASSPAFIPQRLMLRSIYWRHSTYNSSMMGYVGPVAMAGKGDILGSLRYKIKCWNRFRLMSGEAVAAAGACFWCGVNIFGKVVSNFLRTHVHAEVGMDSMNTMYGMKFTFSLTSIPVMHYQRKLIRAWVAGLYWWYGFLTRLYIVMASRSVLKPSYTRKDPIVIDLKMIYSLWTFALLKRGNAWEFMILLSKASWVCTLI